MQILLDNKRQAVDGTPATLKLEPGSYVLTVQREGYVPSNEQVEIKPGDTTRRHITLEPLASGTGFTLVSEPAGAQAFLDGRALEGLTPLKVQSVMPGKHKIEVKTASGSWRRRSRSRPARCSTCAPPSPSPRRQGARQRRRRQEQDAAVVAQRTALPKLPAPPLAPKVKEPDPPRRKAQGGGGGEDRGGRAEEEPGKQPD